jgi:hypothetical protein
MTSNPAYSPCEPAFGWSETAAKPVISASHASSVGRSARTPSLVGRREGMQLAELGPRHRDHLAVALSFIVHEPSGIIAVARARGRAPRSLKM